MRLNTPVSTITETGKLTPFQTSPDFYVSAVQVYENTVRNGEIAHNEQFLLFPQCFLPVWRTFCHFHRIQNFFSLEESKTFCLGKVKKKKKKKKSKLKGR